MAEKVIKGQTANVPFATRQSDRSLVNADTLPTITGAQLAGSAIATTGMSIVQQQDAVPANITGRYYVRILNTTTAPWADKATGLVMLSATIAGAVCTEEINFFVEAPTQANSPYIDTN